MFDQKLFRLLAGQVFHQKSGYAGARLFKAFAVLFLIGGIVGLAGDALGGEFLFKFLFFIVGDFNVAGMVERVGVMAAFGVAGGGWCGLGFFFLVVGAATDGQGQHATEY